MLYSTLPETTLDPENRPSQKENSCSTINFQVRAVSFRESIHPYTVHGNLQSVEQS